MASSMPNCTWPSTGRREMPRTQQIVASLLQTSDRYTRVQLSSVAAMTRADGRACRADPLCRAGAFEEAAGFHDLPPQGRA